MLKQPNIRFGLPWRQPANPASTAAPEVPTTQETSARRDAEAAETMAHALEATGDFKILRRLVPWTAEPRSSTDRIGLIIDLETTGLVTTRNEVLEIAAIKFGYADDRITSVIDTFHGFQQPSAPIEPAITALTGITDAMVDGHHIDSTALGQFVSDVHIVIAHNAAFDRKVAERHWPIFAHQHWACSATGVDWKAYGFGGARLAYLLAECGLFHDAHRALDDCHAVLEILARNPPGFEKCGLEILLDRARRPQHRIWAFDAPFALKGLIKQRGYRWNDGTDGHPKSWYVDADVDTTDAELDYLRKEIFQREGADIVVRTITSLDRFFEPDLAGPVAIRICAHCISQRCDPRMNRPATWTSRGTSPATRRKCLSLRSWADLLGHAPGADETIRRLVHASQSPAQQLSTKTATLANLDKPESLGTAGRRDGRLQQALARSVRDIARMANKAVQDGPEVVVGLRQAGDLVKKRRTHRVDRGHLGQIPAPDQFDD